MRSTARQDTLKPCVIPTWVSYEHLYIKQGERIYLFSLFQNDRGLLYVRICIKLLYGCFNEKFLVSKFTENDRLTAMTYNRNRTVRSLLTLRCMMTNRANIGNRFITHIHEHLLFPVIHQNGDLATAWIRLGNPLPQ